VSSHTPTPLLKPAAHAAPDGARLWAHLACARRAGARRARVAQALGARALARRSGAQVTAAAAGDADLERGVGRPRRPGAQTHADDDVAVDCTTWRLCSVCPGPSMEQGGVGTAQRRINFTVAFVLLLFAYIWWTVVFVAVRTALPRAALA
jgi:hypothetical protein